MSRNRTHSPRNLLSDFKTCSIRVRVEARWHSQISRGLEKEYLNVSREAKLDSAQFASEIISQFTARFKIRHPTIARLFYTRDRVGWLRSLRETRQRNDFLTIKVAVWSRKTLACAKFPPHLRKFPIPRSTVTTSGHASHPRRNLGTCGVQREARQNYFRLHRANLPANFAKIRQRQFSRARVRASCYSRPLGKRFCHSHEPRNV